MRAFELLVPHRVLWVMRLYHQDSAVQEQGLWILLNLTQSNSNIKQRLIRSIPSQQIRDNANDSTEDGDSSDLLEVLGSTVTTFWLVIMYYNNLIFSSVTIDKF